MRHLTDAGFYGINEAMEVIFQERYFAGDREVGRIT